MNMVGKIAVIGAGIMGSGIAQIFAQAGFRVNLMDLNDKIISPGMEKVRKGVEILVRKGKMGSEEGERVWGRIQGLTELEAAAMDADLVIEAIPEEMELKQKTFREIAKIAPAGAILASNTSSLSITKIASAEEIDRACKMNLQHPIGPLELADLVGLDRVLSVLEYLHQEWGEKYRPCPLFKQLVNANYCGRKTGKGV